MHAQNVEEDEMDYANVTILCIFREPNVDFRHLWLPPSQTIGSDLAFAVARIGFIIILLLVVNRFD